jgi:hypothetical protein
LAQDGEFGLFLVWPSRVLVLSVSLLPGQWIAIPLVVRLLHEGQMLGVVQGGRQLAVWLCGLALF